MGVDFSKFFTSFVEQSIARRLDPPLSSADGDEAELYAELGDREKTLTLLEEGLARSPDLLLIQSDPAFNFVHEDPRYRSVIQRVGLPPQF